MKNVARRSFEKLVKSKPVLHRVMNRRLDQEEVLASSRFFQFSNVVLQTRNVSSIQKFERRDDSLIDGAVQNTIRNGTFISIFFGILAFAGLTAGSMGFFLFVLGLGLCAATAWFTLEFRSLYLEKRHNRSDFFVEVYMNSGRRHRFYSGSDETANSIVKTFLFLMYSDDTGVVYRLDQSTNTFMVDNTDRSINNVQIGNDLSFDNDPQEEDEDDNQQ